MPPGEGSDLPEARFIKKFWRFFVVGIAVVALYIALFTTNDIRWFVAAVIVAPLAVIAAAHFDVLSELIPNDAIRNSVTYPLVIILLFAYGWGAADAYTKKTKGAVVEIDGVLNKKTYIGRAGGYVFFWRAAAETVEVVAENQISSLAYRVPEEKPPFMALFQSQESDDGNVSAHEKQATPEGAAD
jgi:hypothetical protein